MANLPAPKIPSLAQRRLELLSLGLPEASVSIHAGKSLIYQFSLRANAFGRVYNCLLRLFPSYMPPEIFVVSPNLHLLAGGEKLPHIYPSEGPGISLCLWWPKRREWNWRMKLSETYIPWTAEWLWYFEDWLFTKEWAGGGEHPQLTSKKARRRALAHGRLEG